jgi:hypothetical protein
VAVTSLELSMVEIGMLVAVAKWLQLYRYIVTTRKLQCERGKCKVVESAVGCL